MSIKTFLDVIKLPGFKLTGTSWNKARTGFAPPPDEALVYVLDDLDVVAQRFRGQWLVRAISPDAASVKILTDGLVLSVHKLESEHNVIIAPPKPGERRVHVRVKFRGQSYALGLPELPRG